MSIWAYKAAQTVETLTNTLIDFPKPIIACVHGGTVGLMFTAMALFDMVLVTKDAYF
jgi:enoyl-CoA hydratase/carnithine racemase